MSFLDSRRTLNVVIAVMVLAVLAVVGYAAYVGWQKTTAVADQTPVSREVKNLIAEVRAKPNDLDLRMKLAQALTVNGRYKDAAEQYNNALKISKDFPPALSGLGFIAAKSKDFKTSEGYWRRVIQITGAQPGASMNRTLETAYFYLGSCLLEQSKYEEAAGAFKEALRINKTASDSHYLLSVSLQKMGSPDLARQELDLTLMLDPKMPEANYDLAMLLRNARDEAGAAEHLRVAANAAPRSEKPIQALQTFGTSASRVAKARAALPAKPKVALAQARIAVAVDPQNIDALIVLGDAQTALGAKKAAASAYQRALAIDATNAQAQQGLAKVKS